MLSTEDMKDLGQIVINYTSYRQLEHFPAVVILTVLNTVLAVLVLVTKN